MNLLSNPNKIISPSSAKTATDKSRTKPGNNVLMIRSMQLPPIRRGKQGDSRGTNEFPWNSRANTLARCRSWKLSLGGRGPGILGALNKVALQPGSTPQRRAETRTPRLEIASEFSAKRTEEFHAIFIIRERRLNSTVSGRPTWDREAWFSLELGVVFNATTLPFLVVGAIKSKTRRLRSIRDEWVV
ncbi:hypothetical protein K0M31_011821 [Melipona bicolor]|uniref:Uncharacterized protein n=1 Tax=Melipona bicolor TaxID=60889 RepID=A0AA40GB38_9HYME|nr:hypothetical protein K0M31_011821 [Melipona bicolor]